MIFTDNMRRLFLYILILIANISIAQYINYKDDSGWNLGLNIGGSWQNSEKYSNNYDTAFSSPFAGFSRGFTFGKSIYEEEGKFFSFDLRFRYLKGENSGWVAIADSFADPNGFYSSLTPIFNDDSIYAYQNYQMKFNEYTFEGVLTLNKLREKTGWIIYGFGGIGLTFYNVNRDILDGTSNSIFDDGFPYDYSSLTFESDIETARQLKNLSDGHFETEIEKNRLRFMPSLGFGIGYQFQKRWSLGIEHKITYALNNNINDIVNSELNDRYYYTALKINFNITGSENSSTSSINSNNQNNNLNPPPTSQGRLPIVNRINPTNNYATWNLPTINFSNSILNLDDFVSSSSNDIKFSVNGISSNNYSFKNRIIYATINLKPGANIIKVKGINEYGSDSKTTIINYEPQSVPNPPSVTITVPNNSPYITNSPYISIHATIFNVDNQSRITYKINGERVYNFSFNGKNFSSNNIPLRNGNNIIQISASNIYGQASDEVVVNYIQDAPKPEVNITFPYDDPYESKSSSSLIRATIKNIKDKYDIEFYINGKKSYNFNYQNTQFDAQNIKLNPGNNNFRIVGKNNSGIDEDQATIFYNNNISPKPIVDITVPSNNPDVTNNNIINISASIFYVLQKSDILLYVNNIKKTEFQFNGNQLQAYNISLKNGKNYIKITAANDQGTAYDETIVIYKPIESPKPLVSFTNPNVPTSESASRYVSLKAKILNVTGKNNVTFSVNGRFLRSFNYIGNTFIASNIALVKGENNIIIKGQNNQGSASDKVIIIYNPISIIKPEINPPLTAKPVVNITKPNKNPFSTSSLYSSIAATILNVKHKSNVTFILNGIQLNNFQFLGNNFQANNVMLREGKNRVVIRGKNSTGTDSDETFIEYIRKVSPNKAPTISYSYPSYSPFNTNNKMILIKGKIQHVENSNNVDITMNGISVKNFLFDPYFDDFECEIQLQNGTNVFKVEASNNTGRDEKSVTIIFNSEECENPIIQLNSPSSNNLTVTNSRAYIDATIINTQNVNFIINGSPSQGYNFDVNNGSFSSMINLSPGSHNYEINAFNSCGTVNEVININYDNNSGLEDEEQEEENIKGKEPSEKELKEEETRILELKRKKAIEEAQQRKLIQQKQRVEEERQRKLQQQQRIEEDRQRNLQLEQQKAEEERQLKLQQQQQQKAEEERQLKLQQQRLQKAEEERQLKLQQQRQQKAEEERQLKLQQQRQQKAEEDRQLKMQQQRQQKAEEERQRKAQQEQQKAEEEAEIKAEEERQRKLQLKQQKAEEEAQQKAASDARKKAQQEKLRKAASDARKKETNSKANAKKGGGK